MDRQMIITSDNWYEVERSVSAEVSSDLRSDGTTRDQLITYLRDLEIQARTVCDRRQTIQIIASGRRLLGDRTTLGPRDGPFSRM